MVFDLANHSAIGNGLNWMQLSLDNDSDEDCCYDWGLGLSGLSTYQLWLQYKVCCNVLVMDSCISQQ